MGRGELERDWVDIQSLDGFLDCELLEGRQLFVVRARVFRSALHVREQSGEEGAAAAGGIQRLVVAPRLGVRPVHGSAGVQSQACGEGCGDGSGEEGAVGRLVAHDAVEEGAGVVCSHVGVGFGDTLRLRRDVSQCALQAADLARSFDAEDDFDGGSQHRLEIDAQDGAPLNEQLVNDIDVVLDGRQVFDLRQPSSGENALVEHRRVHHQQRGDGAAVRHLGVRLEPVQPKVAVERGQQFVLAQMSGGVRHARFQNVQVARHAVAGESGLGQEVHLDGASILVHAAQLEHPLDGLFGDIVVGSAWLGRLVGFVPLLPLAGIDFPSRPLVEHVSGFGFRLFDVHRAALAVRVRLFAVHGVHADFLAAVVVALADDDYRRLVRLVGNRRDFSDCVRADVIAAFAVQHPLDPLFRRADGAFDLGILDETGLGVDDRENGALLWGRLRKVEIEQMLQLFLDALVVGAQGEQDLAQFLPAFIGVAVF